MRRKSAHHDIIHISRARRPHAQAAATEPPCAVRPIWAFNLPEEERIPFAEADMRADLNNGDPLCWVLRKANHIIENASIAFTGESSREGLLRAAIGVIRDHGGEEGIRLLRKALEKHGDLPGVRAAVGEAAARIGSGTDYLLIIDCIKAEDADISRHLGSLSAFVSRHPGARKALQESLEGLHEPRLSAFIDGLRAGQGAF